MSKGTTSFRIKDENALYFLTCATVEWIDVFTKLKYKKVFVDSLNYCIKNKGLEVYAWVLMSNHFHMIAKAKVGFNLSGIFRDMKKHITNEILRIIFEEPEARRSWILGEMKKAGRNNSKRQTYQLWRNDNHPIHLFSTKIIAQKVRYIHNNPVKEGLVSNPEDYVFSSARDYSGENGLVGITLLN